MKDLKGYFDNKQGTGILGTSDMEGNVTMAVYARPHILEDGTVALIMADTLSHANLEKNNKAAYLFMEKVAGYKGIRIYLNKIREEKNSERINELRRRRIAVESEEDDKKDRFLVYFSVEKIIPLAGNGK